MQLDVERLKSEPEPFLHEEGSDWWRERIPSQAGVPSAFAEPLRVSGHAYRGRGDEIVVEARAEAAFELECARCLARYRHPVRESFRLVLQPAGSRTPTEPEAAAALARDGLCATDDPELLWYQGSQVQLDSICLEVLSLALPVKPLCREDCAGLCPRCGANLDTQPCHCDVVESQSPFAVLAALRDDPAGGSR